MNSPEQLIVRSFIDLSIPFTFDGFFCAMTNVGTGKPPPSNDATENEDVLLPTGSNGNDGDDDANVESEEQNDVSASASSVSLVTGLRGLLALYIAVFHFILYSKQEIDICRSGIMSYWF